MRLNEFSKNLTIEQDAEDPHNGSASKSADIHADQKSAMSPSMCFVDLDPGYEYYRFMMQAAASPNNIPVEASLNSSPFSMPFSKEDADMLHHALKRMGKKVKHISTGKSSDPKGTHSKSPVAAIKKNKYGV